LRKKKKREKREEREGKGKRRRDGLKETHNPLNINME
jgi:hypothetical protein